MRHFWFGLKTLFLDAAFVAGTAVGVANIARGEPLGWIVAVGCGLLAVVCIAVTCDWIGIGAEPDK